MAKKQTNQVVDGWLAAALDAGNGGCIAVSTEIRNPIQFEPVIAPVTTKRKVNVGELATKAPGFSLMTANGPQVFGVEDVRDHGDYKFRHRLNSGATRYTSDDYFLLLDMLVLKAFENHTCLDGKEIAPWLTLSVPIAVYNDEKATGTIVTRFCGRRALADVGGCPLNVDIRPERLTIIPESTGGLMYWAFDSQTLKRRQPTTGSTLVVDVGYETTQAALFDGMKYQRNQAFTIWEAGMRVVASEVREYALQAVREVDLSWLDAHMHGAANILPGFPKNIEVASGIQLDIQPAYDAAIAQLATLIADDITTQFRQAVTRVVVMGGGAYHMTAALQERLGENVFMCPEPELANVYGGFTVLKLKKEQTK